MSLSLKAFEIPLAFCLDLLLGDPLWLPHPVRAIGRLIEKGESFLRNHFSNLKWAGIFLMVVLCLFIYGLVFVFLKLTHIFLGKMAEFILETILIYYAIAAHCLAKEANKVLKALEGGDLILARKQLSLIVGRDTEKLEKEKIIKATVETVAENSVDGVIAPLFYTCLGGAPLVWVYKAINTADAMIGYRNERYLHFGWAAARLDDIANFIPARLSVFFIGLAAFLSGFSYQNAIFTGVKEGRKHISPNAGFPEAAFAGALEIRLGGPSTYQGVKVDKPFLGRPLSPLDEKQIRKANKLMLITSLVTVGIIELWVITCT